MSMRVCVFEFLPTLSLFTQRSQGKGVGRPGGGGVRLPANKRCPWHFLFIVHGDGLLVRVHAWLLLMGIVCSCGCVHGFCSWGWSACEGACIAFAHGDGLLVRVCATSCWIPLHAGACNSASLCGATPSILVPVGCLQLEQHTDAMLVCVYGCRVYSCVCMPCLFVFVVVQCMDTMLVCMCVCACVFPCEHVYVCYLDAKTGPCHTPLLPAWFSCSQRILGRCSSAA